MMKYLVKILLIIISSSLILGLLAGVIFLRQFDPNDYKTEIGRWVKTTTGREFIIKGDLTLTLFPWLGITLTQVSLANATGFDASTFASIEQIQLRVKVMPLFKQQLEIDTMVLDQVDLRLQRNAKGQTNWADLVALTGNQSTNHGNLALAIADFKLNGLIVTAATVVWEDQLTDSNYRWSQLNFSTSAITPAQPFNCHLQLTMESNVLPWRTQLTLSSVVYWNFVTQHYRFESLQLAVQLASSAATRSQSLVIPPWFQQFSLTSQLTLDLTNQPNVKLSALRLQVLPVMVTGEVQFKNWYTAPMFTGQLQLVKLNLAALFPRLMKSQGEWWQTLVKTVAVKTQFDFKPAVKSAPAVLRLNQLQIKIDAHQVSTPQLIVNWTAQTVVVESLSIQALGMSLHSQLMVKQLLTQPVVTGKLSIDLTSLTKWSNLKKWSNRWPKIDLTTLTKWSNWWSILFQPTKSVILETKFETTLSAISLMDFQLRAPPNHLSIPKLLIDFTHSRLSAEELWVQLSGIKLKAKLQINQLVSQFLGEGEVQLVADQGETIFRHLSQFGITLLPTLPPLLLTVKPISLATQFKVSRAEIVLSQLLLQVGQIQLQSSQLWIDFTHSRLSTVGLLVQGWGINLKIKLQVNQLFSQPLAEGEMQLVADEGETIFRHLSPFGIKPLPALPPPLTINPISLATQFKVSMAEIVLSQLLLQMGPMQLQSPQIIYRPGVNTLPLTQLRLQILNLVVSAQLRFEPLFPATKFRGSLTVAEFNPRDWLSGLGWSVPKTADTQVLSKMAGTTTVEGSWSHLSLDQLTLQLDQSTLQGQVRVQNLPAPVTHFEGKLDGINVDRYLSPPSSPITTEIQSKTKIKSTTSTKPTNSTQSIQQLGLWLAYLHSLKLTGQLRVDNLQIGGGEIHNALLKITAPN